MCKLAVILFAVTASLMLGRILLDPPVIETRAGMIERPAVPAEGFAGVRG